MFDIPVSAETSAAGAGVLAIAVWASTVMAPTAVAAEYSWQVTGSFEDIDAQTSVETSHSSLRATYYPSSVDDQVGPYELAPFLNRSSYVAVGTGRTKLREQPYSGYFIDDPLGNALLPDDAIDSGPIGVVGPPLIGFPTQFGIDSSEYALDGRYVWPGTGWYAGARAGRSDADVLPVLPFTQTTADHESAGLFAGRYFGSRTALELGFGSDTANQELRVTPFAIGTATGVPGVSDVPDVVTIDLHTRTTTETEDARLSVRHVGQLGSSTFALSASIRSSRSETHVLLPAPPGLFTAIDPFGLPDRGIGIVSPDSISHESFESDRERQIRLSGALFPTRALGVRLTYTDSDHDAFGSSDRVGLSANWFFVRNASVEVEVVRTGSGRRFGDSLDTDSLGVRVLGRF